MKILFIITSTDVGGAEKALTELAISLKDKHELRVISLKPVGQIGFALQSQGIDVCSLGMNPWNQSVVPGRIRRILQTWKPDVVHAMLFRAIEYTRIACFGLRVRLVTTPHYDLSKKSCLCRMLDKGLKELDTLTIAESFLTARYLVDVQQYAKQKVYLLPNSIDNKHFFKDTSLRSQMRAAHKFSEESPVFISVARLAPVKNLMVPLQAFRNILRRYPTAKLVLVGEGSERGRLEEYICLNAMQDSVSLVGEQKNINEWLNLADVFVLSSKEESLPLALLEAQAVGLPCLVSNVGDMPLRVAHGKNGFVFAPKDITLLSCFMTELMDENLRRQMGEQSLRVAAQLEPVAQHYQQVYQQLLNNSFHVETGKDNLK